MRALSILWVVLFHAGWYSGPHIPLPMYADLVFSSWMLPVWRGDFGVDVFFVLSGFLIAGMLIDEVTSTGRIRLGLFYARRLMRLWPALGVAALADVLLVGDNSSMIWANLFYISNFIPILHAAMGWTWSLAIEEQFYLVCPLLVLGLGRLGDRFKLVVLSGIGLVLALVAASVVSRHRLHAVDAEIVVNRDFLRWTYGYDHLYVKPWMRAGPLLAGVAAAYVHRWRGGLAALTAKPRVATALFVFALVSAALSTHWPLAVGAPRPLEIAYLATFRSAFGVAVAFVLLFVLSPHPLGRRLGDLLSSRALYPIGQLAYSAYLLNPIVATFVHRATAPLVWGGDAEPIPLFFTLDLVATFGAALVLHLLVERPFMELRPKARPRAEAPLPQQVVS